MRYAIKIGYDGMAFNGFAIQPNKKTVEGEILKRLIKTKIIEDRSKNKFQYAARTDKGVSAFGNVIVFNSPANPLKAMNGIQNIWITGYAEVDEKFNPRHAKYKIYRYYIKNDGLNLNEMAKAIKIFEGVHDFSSFARIDKRNPIREITKTVFHRDKIIKIDIYGKSFLWQQVRRMAAAIIKVGQGKACIDDIKNALNGMRMDFGVAPANNLVLMDVVYDKIKFKRLIPDELIFKKEMLSDAIKKLIENYL